MQVPCSVVVDENLTSDPLLESPDAPAEPPVKVPPPESRFLFVDVAALRAKQLRRGARCRLSGMVEGPDAPADQPRKPERVAMEEVRQGLVVFSMGETVPVPPGENQ
jgi:DNA-directed RNA polymerase subunit K/omega